MSTSSASKFDDCKALPPRRFTQSNIVAKKSAILGLLVAPNQPGRELEGISGTQFMAIEASLSKIPQPVRRLYFAPSFAKHREPTVSGFIAQLRRTGAEGVGLVQGSQATRITVRLR